MEDRVGTALVGCNTGDTMGDFVITAPIPVTTIPGGPVYLQLQVTMTDDTSILQYTGWQGQWYKPLLTIVFRFLQLHTHTALPLPLTIS